MSLRVLSYNVRSLRDDRRAVAAVIRAAQPDLVCVQEAPRFLRWRSTAAWLARESGLLVVTGGRPAGAMLLLCGLHVQVLSHRDVLLSRAPGLHQRGLAVAEVLVHGRRWTVASMHLDLDPAERRRHAEEVLAELAGASSPVVLAGDVNEEPDGPAWSALTRRLTDAWAAAGEGDGRTWSATGPVRRIDGVFVDPAVRVERCQVLSGPDVQRASDHRPVLAVLAAGQDV